MTIVSGWMLLACALATGCQPARDSSRTAPSDGEKHRPRFHFSPPEMWMNDPNGMVYHDGEYHLFYQHYPDSTVWGPMHWGHAISKDLIRWEHMPIALYPDSLGYIFSGSAVVDAKNTSGLGTDDSPPLVAVFTYHSEALRKAGRKDYQSQGIAFSTDDGRSWKKYDGNPVLKNPGIEDFRDPKVFWHEESGKWIMILAVKDHVELYQSPDLKTWEKSGEFGKNVGAHGGVWECPDLFPLTSDDGATRKWIMLVSINPGGPYGGSATQYFVGNFDGKEFTNDNADSTTLWIDYGKDNYAGVTWSNIPASDGRRIFIGWMSNWQYANSVPTETWRSAMTLPRSLHLSETSQGIRVASRPVKELENIRKESYVVAPMEISGTKELEEIPFGVSTAEIVLEFDMPDADANLGVELSNEKGEKISIGFDAGRNSFYVDRRNAGSTDFSGDFSGIHRAPRISEDRSLKFHLIVDVASVELFADDGQTVITDIFFPGEPLTTMKLHCAGGVARLKSGKVTRLSPI